MYFRINLTLLTNYYNHNVDSLINCLDVVKYLSDAYFQWTLLGIHHHRCKIRCAKESSKRFPFICTQILYTWYIFYNSHVLFICNSTLQLVSVLASWYEHYKVREKKNLHRASMELTHSHLHLSNNRCFLLFSFHAVFIPVHRIPDHFVAPKPIRSLHNQQKCGLKLDSRALLHWPTHHSDGVEDNGSNESKTSVVKFVITLSGLQELGSDLQWQSGKLELLFDSEYNTGNFSHGGLLVRNTGNSGPKIWMLCINEPSDWRNSK